MRASRFLLAMVGLLAGVGGFSTTNEAEDRFCVSATSREVRALYATYADLLKRGDVEALTGLYSPDAILMGPAAESIRIGRAEIATYYTTFLQRTPTVVALERVVRTDCGTLGDTGVEALSVRPDAAARRTVSLTSRFSLSYARFGDRWLIVHHHQEIVDAPPTLDVPFASAPPSRLTTGANPPAVEPLVLPPVPFDLPSSAPVILVGQPPLVPKQVVLLDSAAIEHLMALARQSTANPNVTIPRTAFGLGLNASPIAAPVVEAPVRVPATNFGLAETPPSIDVPPTPVQVVPSPAPQALPSQQPVKATVKPAVASFTQRVAPQPARQPEAELPQRARPAAALPVPPRPEPPKAKAKAAVILKPVPVKEQPAKTGKFLRWVDQTPIFDD